MKTFDYPKIEKSILDFVKLRKWDQFHSPKNLSMALTVEASELLEIFQWMSEKESLDVVSNPEKMKSIEEELSDIVYYVMLMSSKLDINLEEAMLRKMVINESKYPADKALGNSKKYDEL